MPTASITTSAPRPVAGLRAEELDELLPLRAAADDDRPAARIGDARASISPIGPAPRIATVSPACDPGALDAAQAARERLDHRRDLGREPGGTSCRLTAAIRSGTTIQSA